jgi:hypothetical protein
MTISMEFRKLHAMSDEDLVSCGQGLIGMAEQAGGGPLSVLGELGRVLWKEILVPESERRLSGGEAQERYLQIEDATFAPLEVTQVIEYSRLVAMHLLQQDRISAAEFFAEVNRAFAVASETDSLEKLVELQDLRQECAR